MSRLELGNPQLREILWIIGISVAALLFWLYLPFNWVGDDHWFRDVVEINFAGNVFAYLAHRYESWTSRIFIELVMVTVIQHIRIWRIISALAMSLVIIIPTRLVSAQVATRVRLLPVSAILVAAIPMTVILETGYVATTLNYLWPLAAGLIAATPGVYLVQGRPVRRWWYPIAILCGLFAGSSEMVAVLLLVLYGATAVIAWPHRKCFVPNLAFAVGFLALVMFALLSPGNSARTAIETEVWWPEHAYLSFPRLIEIGFSATLRAIFLQGFTLPLIYFVVLAVILFRRWGPNWPVLIVMAPIVGLLTQGFNASVSFTTAERIIRLDNIWEAYTWYGLLRGDDPFTWFAFLLMVGLLACVILATWFAANSHWQAIMLLGILSMGFASKFILAFSPTVWASGDRTNTYLLFAFALAALILINDALLPPVTADILNEYSDDALISHDDGVTDTDESVVSSDDAATPTRIEIPHVS